MKEIHDYFSMPSVALARHVLEDVLPNDKPLDELRAYKREMLRRNFHAPLTFISRKANKKEEKEDNADEAADIRKQKKIFMEIASLKKTALSMTTLYIYAEKLKEKLNNRELANYVPKAGSYVDLLATLRYNAVLAFKDIYTVLSSFGEMLSVEYCIVDDNGLHYITSRAYADKLSLKIKKSKMKRYVRPLIRSPYVRKILIATSLSYSQHMLESSFQENDGELSTYNNILHKYGIRGYSRIDAKEGFDKLKQELVDNGFASFIEGSFTTREDIVGKITARRSFFHNRIKELASKAIADEIEKALNGGNRIPTMARNPSTEQLKVLPYLDPSKEVLQRNEQS
ncbi:MAG: hypothetical protein D6769_01785 [Methanobacteriota archaeon]|nr:MAG: hypothetical protein D6769_01785 [Euryarchaeota archaeon]